ncbi:hypothetical protein ABGB18_13665 [Nonomuraea sp. B12E4]|uniref:hypothetical protein n=1 Tax=Nonomuraea sp. B12E4 TaxID=3153564 RepID=UPI00325C56AA
MTVSLRTLFLSIALVLSVVLMGSPASAAPERPSVPLKGGATTQSFTMTLTRKADTPKGVNAPADVITCGGYLSIPYVNSLYNAVRTEIEVQCSAVVDSIDLYIILYRDGYSINPGPQRYNPANYGIHYSSAPCQGTTNTYFAGGTAVFTKAGYVGSPLVMNGTTPQVTLAC